MGPVEESIDNSRMSLGEHLDELRRRLIRGCIALVVAFCVAWPFADVLADVILQPYRQSVAWQNEHWAAEAEAFLEEHPDELRSNLFEDGPDGQSVLIGSLDSRLLMTAPGEGFLFYLKVCFYFALVFGGPFALWQFWQFIAAGLYAKEQGAVRRYFPFSILLGALGIGFGFLVMVPYAMFFLGTTIPIELARPDIKLQDYFAFLTSLCIGLGLVFQLPILMTFAARVGLVLPETMASLRGHFLVAAFLLAALLTPPDPFTQLFMAVPMVVLYEIGIRCARVAARKRPGIGEPDAA